MKPTLLVLLHAILFSFYFSPHSDGQSLQRNPDSICHIQIVSDTLFQSAQGINLLLLDKELLDRYSIDFVYHPSELLKTSQFALCKDALAAINGSFFDMNKGGSVTYFEKNDSVLSKNRSPELKWAVPDSLINGAVILTKDHFLEIESAELQQLYELSDREAFVMVSGPLLIKDSLIQKLPDMSFTHKRHPRTCLGITPKAIIFITIDGRSDQAAGMNLHEVQKFMLQLGCRDAINLDGGGSTSMWIKGKGLVNKPSDKSGERPVANALIIREK